MLPLMIRPEAGRRASLSSRKRCNMPGRRRKRQTILHFCCDHAVLTLRGRFLNDVGYHVLNSSNGFEAIELATRERVDAAVLDLDRNHAEVTLIAREIKRHRPRLPTIVLTEEAASVEGVRELADVLVPKEKDPETLVQSLRKVLTGSPDPGV